MSLLICFYWSKDSNVRLLHMIWIHLMTLLGVLQCNKTVINIFTTFWLLLTANDCILDTISPLKLNFSPLCFFKVRFFCMKVSHISSLSACTSSSLKLHHVIFSEIFRLAELYPGLTLGGSARWNKIKRTELIVCCSVCVMHFMCLTAVFDAFSCGSIVWNQSRIN